MNENSIQGFIEPSGSGYIVRCDKLPGGFVEGETKEITIERAIDALSGIEIEMKDAEDTL